MSTELLLYCHDQLRSKPQALNITQPMDSQACSHFNKIWAQSRFEHQQQSILHLPPDHPDYGRSFLWDYELEWTEVRPGSYLLRVQYAPNQIHPPRELILLASILETTVPFNDAFGAPTPKHVFRAAKSRLLGGEGKRNQAALPPSLRPAVASVQYTSSPEGATISAINLNDIVRVEN